MNANWIAALACGAALLLAACSGSPAPNGEMSDAGTYTEASAPQPATTDEFDDELRDALADVTAAVSAADNPVQVASGAARRLVTQARADLGTALTNLRARLAGLIAGGDAARIGAVSGLIAEAEGELDAARAGSAEARLRAAEAKLREAALRESWIADVPARSIFNIVDVERRLRKDGGARGGNYLDTTLTASHLPPRMYESGKTVMGEAGNSGDQLQMRGFPMFHFGTTSGRDLRYRPGGDTAADVVENLHAIQNNRPDLLAGLTINSDGLVIEMGGQHAPGYDFRHVTLTLGWSPLLAVDPARPETGQDNGYDLILNFGRPGASPQGNAEHYWQAALMPTAALEAQHSYLREAATEGGETVYRTLAQGAYEVRLSNHIGLDTNTEDPDEPYPDDDTNHYLTYAAYGFMDYYRPGTTTDTPLQQHHSQRVFPFQVGYDAFKDEAGKRTTDIGDAAITSGTFKGRTMAVAFYVRGDGLINIVPEVVTRMRGDIELTATISGTAANNTIAGAISNMEDWDRNGFWKASTIMPPGTLQSPTPYRFGTDGTIDAKGEFTGTFANYPSGYDRGGYRGNFYGPVESLEAAGTWAFSPATGGGVWGIAGSFGAARVDADGEFLDGVQCLRGAVEEAEACP